MKRRNLYLCGLIAPALFIFTAIVGGLLRPGYSHVADTVSELFSPGSPNRIVLSGLYILFSGCLILFGAGLRKFVNHTGKKTGIGSWAAVLFILVGVLNLFTATIFPQDPWGTAPSIAGELHKIISAVITFLSFGYMILFGIWFLVAGINKTFWIYSLVTIIAAIGSSIWFMTSVGTPLMGITERVVILIGLQFTLALSILVLRADIRNPSLPDRPNHGLP